MERLAGTDGDIVMNVCKEETADSSISDESSHLAQSYELNSSTTIAIALKELNKTDDQKIEQAELTSKAEPDPVSTFDLDNLVVKTEDGDWKVMDIGRIEDAECDENDEFGAPPPYYTCGICSKEFVIPALLSEHLRAHFEGLPATLEEDGAMMVCSECGMLHGRDAEHTCAVEHDCEVCGERHANADSLRKHANSHHQYLCELCGRSFANTSNLCRHMLVHRGERKHTCKFCSKAFSQKVEMEMHQRVHTGERPFSCEACGKSFALKAGLKQHKLLHSDERPYVCRTCGKSFRQPASVRQHERQHIPMQQGMAYGPRKSKNGAQKHQMPAGVTETLYVCNTCDKVFVYADGLTKHMRIHTGERPFKCQLCFKAFTQATHLTQHLRTHTGERPYACEVCGKTFAISGNRNQHALTHTKERPYACNTCGKTFGQPFYLSRHSRIHTEKEKTDAPAIGERTEMVLTPLAGIKQSEIRDADISLVQVETFAII